MMQTKNYSKLNLSTFQLIQLTTSSPVYLYTIRAAYFPDCLFICLSYYKPTCQYQYLSICLSLYFVYLGICRTVYQSICESVYLLTWLLLYLQVAHILFLLSTCQLFYPSIFLPVCMIARLSIYQQTCLSANLFVFLFFTCPSDHMSIFFSFLSIYPFILILQNVQHVLKRKDRQTNSI